MNFNDLPQAIEIALLWTARLSLLAILVAIGLSDIRARRIPNNLVLTGLAITLAWHAFAPTGVGLFDRYAPGALGFGTAALGALLGFVAFFVLYRMRVVGAGDVKLMAVLGAAFGPKVMPALMLSIFLCGGMIVLVRIIDTPRRRAVFANMRVILFERLVPNAGLSFDPNTDTADRVPFALAMAAGAIVYALILGGDLLAGWSVR